MIDSRASARPVTPAAGLTAGPAAGLAAGLVAIAVLVAGCAHRVTVDPITVEPIYLTLDITLKIDRELDQFFDFEDESPPVGEPERTEPGAPS